MITRFRLEGTGKTQIECSDELRKASEKVMEVSGLNRGNWHCTDEVIEKAGFIYRGRIIWKAQLRPSAVGGIKQ
jgi:hypothetical protein